MTAVAPLISFRVPTLLPSIAWPVLEHFTVSAELSKEVNALQQSPDAVEKVAREKFKLCRRRLIRALEVKIITGKSILELQSQSEKKLRYPEITAVKLDVAPEVLAEKIALRAAAMLKNGWIEEAEEAIKRGLLTSPTAHQALGYKIIAAYLNGEFDRSTLYEKICAATRQYARRQRTWFRHQHPEASALTAAESENFLRQISDKLCKHNS